AQGWGLKMLSAERLERILGCPCGWRGGPVRCEAPTRTGGQPVSTLSSGNRCATDLRQLRCGICQGPQAGLVLPSRTTRPRVHGVLRLVPLEPFARGGLAAAACPED